MSWTLPSSGVLHIGNATLEYTIYGPSPAHAPTIVLLHEGLGCVSLWKDFPSKLSAATGHGVFVFSRAGYGNSSAATLPRSLDYMTREAVDILPLVLDEIEFQTGTLLGHSDGATIAAINAGLVKDPRVHALVVIAPHFFTEEMGLASIAQAKTAYENNNLKDRLAQHHRDVDNAFYGWNNAWLDPDFKKWKVCHVIDGIQVPVLAIQGEDDQYGTIAQIDSLQDRLPTPPQVVLLPNCAHSPHREQTKQTVEIIYRFTQFHFNVSSECTQDSSNFSP